MNGSIACRLIDRQTAALMSHCGRICERKVCAMVYGQTCKASLRLVRVSESACPNQKGKDSKCRGATRKVRKIVHRSQHDAFCFQSIW